MITINNLPSEILDAIFLQVGRRSHEELNNIRRVSRTWDERIKIKLRAVNPSEEWGRIIGSRIKRRFTSASQAEIARAASMAHLGHLGTMKNMFLYDVDLSSIPAGHLSSLASCVTGRVHISRVEYSSKGVLKSPSLFSPLQPNVSEPPAPHQRISWRAANSAFGNNLGDLYVTIV